MKLSFLEVQHLIEQRRSIYPKSFDSEQVSEGELKALLEAARFAPNHKNTQPWHFVVYRGKSLEAIIEKQIAQLYDLKGETEETIKKAEKMRLKGQLTTAMIAVVMKRDEQQRIPAFEEEWAVACAVQNMLLIAPTLNIGAYWSTGNTDTFEMRTELALDEEDRHMGWLFVGRYFGETPFRKERKSVEGFTVWKD